MKRSPMRGVVSRWLAGASVGSLAFIYGRAYNEIEDAIRREMNRTMRRRSKRNPSPDRRRS